MQLQGGPKKVVHFQHTISLEQFNDADFTTMFRKSLWWNVITNFWRIYFIFFVKYANNYCIIGYVICINMHHHTADDKASILALRVEKRWNVDKMILEFPNKQWKRQNNCITWCEKLIKLEVLLGCMAVAGIARSVVKASYDGDTGHMEHRLK